MIRWLCLALVATTALPARAADWPEFRGPGGKGVYAGKPVVTEWGVEKNVTWKTPLPGVGWSSPIAVGGKLYMTTAVPVPAGDRSDYSLRTMCVDQAKGGIVWDTEVFVRKDGCRPAAAQEEQPRQPDAGVGRQAAVGPLRPHGHGPVWTSTAKSSGRPRNSPTTRCTATATRRSWSMTSSSSAATARDVTYLAALDQTTGKVRWKTDRNTSASLKFSFATCLLVEHAGKRVIVSPAANFCLGYDPKTGAELWRLKYPQPGWSLIAPPVYSHGLVIFSTGYMNQHLLAFKPEGTGDITGNIVWDVKRNAPNTPTPIVVGDEVYMLSDSGFLTCLDVKTGTVHYAERLAGKAYSASPIVAAGNLYFTSEDGVGQVIAAGKEFKEVSRSNLVEKSFATFVPVDGSLYVRTESQLYRFDPK